MKIVKYAFLGFLFVLFIGVLSNPNSENHKITVKDELNIQLKNEKNDSFSKLNNVDNIIDSLIRRDNYYVFSKTQLVVNDKLTDIGYGCLGKVWISKELNNLFQKAVDDFYSFGEVSNSTVLKTVKIGNQIWTTQNLDVSIYNNGDSIPQVKSAEEWVKLKTGAWCYYNNDSILGKKYGKIYNWYAVADPRGIAPIGYHIPSDNEWKTLVNYLGGYKNKWKSFFYLTNIEKETGYKMKAVSGWKLNETGDNESGFFGLPGAKRDDFDGSFSHDKTAFWWSTTESGAHFIWTHALYDVSMDVKRLTSDKTDGYQVRCVKN